MDWCRFPPLHQQEVSTTAGQCFEFLSDANNADRLRGLLNATEEEIQQLLPGLHQSENEEILKAMESFCERMVGLPQGFLWDGDNCPEHWLPVDHTTDSKASERPSARGRQGLCGCCKS